MSRNFKRSHFGLIGIIISSFFFALSIDMMKKYIQSFTFKADCVLIGIFLSILVIYLRADYGMVLKSFFLFLFIPLQLLNILRFISMKNKI